LDIGIIGALRIEASAVPAQKFVTLLVDGIGQGIQEDAPLREPRLRLRSLSLAVPVRL